MAMHCGYILYAHSHIAKKAFLLIKQISYPYCVWFLQACICFSTVFLFAHIHLQVQTHGANRTADKVCRCHCHSMYRCKPTPCHTNSLLLSTMLRCVATEIEIMIMCPSDCIKVLPLQKKAGRHEMQMTMWSRWIECCRFGLNES